jgi:glycosyltransferase involved in cell wall biosynthesis
MRLRRVISLANQELRAIRHGSKMEGGRRALITRVRHDLELDEIDSNRIGTLESRLSALETVHSQLRAEFASTQTALAATHGRLTATQEQLAATETRLGTAEGQLAASIDAGGNVEAAMRLKLAEIDRRAELVDLAAQIGPVTTWVRAARLTNTPRISVLLATYNRHELLRGAVDSVRAQEYPHWELVIIDDGSTDGTSQLLTRLSSEDERIVVVTQPHRGVGAARNAGLAQSGGEIICYLDDDNGMQPLWLKAVAWAYEREPELELLYGARVRDVDGDSNQEALPYLHFESFERSRLEQGNFIDLGVIAHRRSLSEAHFDESLEALGDWDLILRLTEDRPPLPLPVVASIYNTSAPNRITRSRRRIEADAEVRARVLRKRRLRVLAYNALFPLVPETYIGEEMKALTDNGAALAWCTDRWSPSPVKVTEPVYTDVSTAVREFDPDVLFLYWSSFAIERLDELSAVGVPFAFRVHSFDFDPEVIERVRAHPLCVGTWAYPHHARQIVGANGLVALLTTGESFPEANPERSIVLSASAGLPKKDWPTLVGAFAELAKKGVDCRIVVGITDQFEEEPALIRELIRETGASIMLSVDVPHDQVIALLAHTAAVVYTKHPGGPFGMPRSIIEGMYAGTSVIVPDNPEAALVAGPNRRMYAQSEDIVRHVIEILAGGHEVEAEREFNHRFATDHFADPVLATSFATELTRAVAQWRSG